MLFGKSGAYAYLKDCSAPLSIHGHDISAPTPGNIQPRTIYEEQKLKISAVAGHNRDSPAVIYRIDYAGKSIAFSGDIDAQGLAGLRANAGPVRVAADGMKIEP